MVVINCCEKTHLNCAGKPRLYKMEETSGAPEDMHSLVPLFAKCECGMTTCDRLLPPSLAHHGGITVP